MYKKGSCWDGYVQAGMKKKGFAKGGAIKKMRRGGRA